MVSANILFARFRFLLFSEILKVLAVTLTLLHLPRRLLRLLSKSSATPPRPCVRLTTHQPPSSYATPRDTVVLIHGFPDSSSLWDPTIARLTADGYRCITVDLPGSKGESVPYIVYPSDTVGMIVDSLQPVCDKPFTLIGHDWGSMYSLRLREAHPHLVHRLINVDVGMMSPKSDIHWTVWLCLLSYQSLFAMMFFLGEPCAGLQKFFIKNFNYHARPLEEVTIDMNYHYAGALVSIVKRIVQPEKEPVSGSAAPPIPHLFVYAQKKIFNFHDATFVDKVRCSPNGEVISLACEHWIMHDCPEAWSRILTEWLQKSEVAIPQAQ